MPEDQIQPLPDPMIRPGEPPRPPVNDAIAPGPARFEAPATATAPATDRPADRPAIHHELKDGTREIVETIVFVVVLVLLLKTFLAEAFVIPTGSMAETLLGYHKDVVCDKCRFPFRVNASDEVEKRPRDLVIEWTCPNCRYHNRLQLPPKEGIGP